MRKNNSGEKNIMSSSSNLFGLTLASGIEDATHYDHLNNNYLKISTNKDVRTRYWKDYCNYILEREDTERRTENSSLETTDDDSDLSSSEEDNSGKVVLSEIIRPNENVPVRIKFTFEFDTEHIDKKSKSKLYDGVLIHGLVNYTRDAIRKRFILSKDSDELVCSIFEKKSLVRKQDKSLIIINIQFQNLRTNYKEANVEFRKILEMYLDDQLLSELKLAPNNNWSSIISFDDMKKLYPMYMCDDLFNPSILSASYEAPDHPNNDPVRVEGYELFDPTKHLDYINGTFSPGDEINKKTFWSPMFFTKDYSSKIANNTDPVPRVINRKKFIDRAGDKEEVRMVKMYLNMIKNKRLNERHSWEAIGKALKTVIEGPTGLDIWKRLTSYSTKFKIEECQKLYKNYRDNNITIKTIAWYAKMDQPIKYNNFKMKRFGKAIEKAVGPNGRDFEVAEALCILLDLEYAHHNTGTRTGGKSWYRYYKNRWEKLPSILTLRNYVSREFTHHVKRMESDYKTKMENCGAADTNKSVYKFNIVKIGKIIKNAGSFTKKSTLVKHVSDLMTYEEFDFKDALNSNYNLLGVRNGVIECIKKKAFFRPSKPEDYIAKQTNVRYKKKYTWESIKVKEVMRWFKQIHQVKEEREYFIKILSSFLQGRNPDKNWYFIVGPPNCGKSAIANFIMGILKGYTSTVPEHEITIAGKNKTGADPGLANAMDNNVAFWMELTGTINHNKFNRITGSDPMGPRRLHENPEESRKPRFKPVSLSNFYPTFDVSTDAVIERTVIVETFTRWVYNPPKTEEARIRLRRFKRDKDFDEKLNSMLSAGLWIMVQYFKKYRKEGLKMPSTILKRVKDYWRTMDIVGNFINDRIKMIEDDTGAAESVLRLETIYGEYDKWLGKYFPNSEKQDKIKLLLVLKERFNSHGWRKYDGNGWPGLAIKYGVGFN